MWKVWLVQCWYFLRMKKSYAYKYQVIIYANPCTCLFMLLTLHNCRISCRISRRWKVQVKLSLCCTTHCSGTVLVTGNTTHSFFTVLFNKAVILWDYIASMRDKPVWSVTRMMMRGKNRSARRKTGPSAKLSNRTRLGLEFFLLLSKALLLFCPCTISVLVSLSWLFWLFSLFLLYNTHKNPCPRRDSNP